MPRPRRSSNFRSKRSASAPIGTPKRKSGAMRSAVISETITADRVS
jgi:hypothetical protein